MKLRWLLAVVVACLSVLLASPALASRASKREIAESKQRAQTLMNEGVKLARRSDFANALTKFQAAYEAYASPNILINVGTSLRHLGRHAEAADAYEEYLSEPGVDRRRRRELERLIKKIDKQVGWIEISVRVEDSDVRLDGRLVDLHRHEGAVRVDPGDHSVSVEADDLPTAIESFHIEEAERVTLDFRQVKPPPPPAPPPEADKGAVQRAVSYAVGGVGAVGMLIGAVVGGVALSTNSAASDECVTAGNTLHCDADGVELADEAGTQATAATAAFVTGVALVGAGLAIYLTAPDTELGDDVHDEPGVATVARAGVVGPGAVGLSLTVKY
jgi:hypothetical protein